MPLRRRECRRAPRAAFARVVRREIGRVAARPLYVALMIALPAFVFAYFGILFRDGTPANLSVAVLDADDSPSSRRLVRMLDATRSISVDHRPCNGLEGERLLRSGACYALVEIPRRFERELLGGRTATVSVYVNNTYYTAAARISGDARKALATFSAETDAKRRIAQGTTPDEAASAALPIRLVARPLYDPFLSYEYYLSPTFLPAMLAIFVTATGCYAVGIEIKRGTARRWWAAAGGSVGVAVLGKLAPQTFYYALLASGMNFLLFYAMGVPFRGSLWLLGIANLLLVVGFQAVSVVFVLLTANLRLALSICSFYAATAFAFVGITYPAMEMGGAAAVYRLLLPLTYHLNIYLDQSIRGVSACYAVSDLAALVGFPLIAAAVTAWRGRPVLTQSKYWGRE